MGVTKRGGRMTIIRFLWSGAAGSTSIRTLAITLGSFLALVVSAASYASEDTTIQGWTDPMGDISLANADIISGSATVSNGLVDFRIRFVSPPFPTGFSNQIGICIDTDLNPGTGHACGGACASSSGVGADRAGGVGGGPGALDTGNFTSSGNLGLDPCCQGSFDPDSNTLRLLVPLSALDNAQSFHYAVNSVASGGVGLDCAPAEMHFDSPSGYWISELGTPDPFHGAPLCGMMVAPGQLKFGTVAGTANPASGSVSIRNSRAGALTWSATEAIPWLTLSSTSGSAPQTVNAAVDVTGLAPGVYTGTATFETHDVCADTQRRSVDVVLGVLAPPGEGPCPAGLAGKLVTALDPTTQQQTLHWGISLGTHDFSPGETLVVDFAIDPLGSGATSPTSVFLDESSGRTGFTVNFANGLVNGLLPYNANAWNRVRAVFDMGAKQYVLSVNGALSAVTPFHFEDSNSVRSLGVFFTGAANSTAWIDEIKVTKSSQDASTVLFRETFDDGRVYSAGRGTITSVFPPMMPVPQSCTDEGLRLTLTQDKNFLAWTTPGVPTTYDVMANRVPGRLTGDFSAFGSIVCDHPVQRLDIGSAGAPPAESMDCWLARPKPQGVPGTWDEGGNQVQPRNMPPCMVP